MSRSCPNCGYVDEDHDREHGYSLDNEDRSQSADTSWRDGQGFVTDFSTPQQQSVRCPNCGERI